METQQFKKTKLLRRLDLRVSGDAAFDFAPRPDNEGADMDQTARTSRSSLATLLLPAIPYPRPPDTKTNATEKSETE